MTERPIAGQYWNADQYRHNAAFVAELGADVLSLLDAQVGERILDLGCGDGELTVRLRELGADVVGLEPDPSLAASARAHGLEIRQQDAHQPFGQSEFDAVFSNAALHWMHTPETVLANIRAALKPGGRLVVEQGGFGNVAAIITALQASLEAAGQSVKDLNPWDFPSPQLQNQRLTRCGFSIRHIGLLPRPTPLPSGVRGWLETFASPFLVNVRNTEHQRIIEDTERRLIHLRDNRGTWFADYVRLRFEATVP